MDGLFRGRPTSYKDEYVDQLIAFFESAEPYKEVEEIITFKGGAQKIETKLVPNKLPTLTKFAKKIGVTNDTMTDRANATFDDGQTYKYPDFRCAHKRAKELQKDFLNENGLIGLYNSSYCKFVAVNYTDMKDKQDIQQNTNLSASGALTDFIQQAIN